MQLEQTQVKAAETSAYTDVAARAGKARPGARSKCRRAPYSPASSTAGLTAAAADRPAEYAAAYPERTACDYDAEMSLQSLYNMGRAAAYQGLAPDGGSCKYSDVYGHTSGTAPPHGDPVAMYQSYAGNQRYCDERAPAYRGRYDDLFYHAPAPTREHASYPTLYMPSDELRGVGSSDSASDSLNVSSCVLQQGASCSRSSSREDCYVGQQEAAPSHLQARYHLAAFSSNRSDSSASDVDVVSDEHHAHAHAVTDMRSGANVDGLEEATQLAQRRLYDAARTTSSGDAATKDSAMEHHPSVIRCRQTFTDDVVAVKMNGRSDQRRHAAEPGPCVAAEAGHTDSLYGSAQLMYDGYKPCLPAFQHDLAPPHRASYSVMTQPGYTSVIVDTQQYQLANGFVH